jgi:hypothetical protein
MVSSYVFLEITKRDKLSHIFKKDERAILKRIDWQTGSEPFSRLNLGCRDSLGFNIVKFYCKPGFQMTILLMIL